MDSRLVQRFHAILHAKESRALLEGLLPHAGNFRELGALLKRSVFRTELYNILRGVLLNSTDVA